MIIQTETKTCVLCIKKIPCGPQIMKIFVSKLYDNNWPSYGNIKILAKFWSVKVDNNKWLAQIDISIYIPAK